MTQKPTENGRGAPAKTAQAQGGEASNWEGFKGTEILHADSLSKLKAFPDGVFGGVITDPPYSSGAFSISSKQADTSKKYSSIKSDNKNVSFMGDGKDQRSWTRWMAEILSEAYRASKDGAAICAFTDWRQLPAMTDALQWAGWHWRGVVVWNKTNSRPQKGRFRQDAEFVVWGSKGNLPVDRAVPILPGVFDIAAPAYSKRQHQTEKPLELMRALVKIVCPGEIILDPFCGSGTTVLAAKLEGYPAVGIEIMKHYAETAKAKVAEA